MKTTLAFLFFCISFLSFSQTDSKGCTDHPVFPTRIPGYFIESCEVNDFSQHVFITEKGIEKTVEGKKWVFNYRLKPGNKAVSEVFIRKNYCEAIKKQNGKVLYENAGRGCANGKTPDGVQVWMDISGYVGEGPPEMSELYILTIIEVAAMEQVITAVELSNDIKNTGKAVLYIQFDVGKATIKPESNKILEQMAKTLNADKALKVYIVGHTDNTGTLEANLKLSQERAEAVVKELVSKYNVSAAQLSAKSVASLAPVSSNSTEAGRAQNRRVEMVKQ